MMPSFSMRLLMPMAAVRNSVPVAPPRVIATRATR
jgi:hypothetical protein